MQSNFFISPRPDAPRLKISHRLFAVYCVAQNTHSWMLKAPIFGMNILAVLPFASDREFSRLGGNDCASHYDKDCNQIFLHRYATDITGSFTKIGTVTGGVLAVPSSEQFGSPVPS